MGDNRLMEGIRQRGVKMCHTRDAAADISQMVSDKRSPPIFVQPQRLKHKYGKNTAGFSYKPQVLLSILVSMPIRYFLTQRLRFPSALEISPGPQKSFSCRLRTTQYIFLFSNKYMFSIFQGLDRFQFDNTLHTNNLQGLSVYFS